MLRRMSHLSDRDKCNPALVERLFTQDRPALARLLRSFDRGDFFCPDVQLTGVSSSISVLGLETFLGFSLAVDLRRLIWEFHRTSPIDQVLLWRHSWITAVAARDLAVRLGLDPFLVQNLGLFDKLGDLFISAAYGREYEQLVAVGRGSVGELRDGYQDVLGFDNDEVHRAILGSLEFPATLAVRRGRAGSIEETCVKAASNIAIELGCLPFLGAVSESWDLSGSALTEGALAEVALATADAVSRTSRISDQTPN